MQQRAFDPDAFAACPVVGIVRGVTAAALAGVMEAAAGGGLRWLEITLNTPAAPELIAQAQAAYGARICIGAGTVLSLDGAEKAAAAGAAFIVAPTLNPAVAGFCQRMRIPYFPGAYTPTEIEQAWHAGAHMVKVFPASRLGADYFREIKGPFPDIRLMAVGGVSGKNAADYLTAGADAVAFGGSIFTPARMQNGEFQLIAKEIADFLFAVKKNYSKIV